MACEVRTYGHINDLHKVQEYFGLSHDENWVNSITYSISPTGELIALAMGEKLSFLSAVWDNKAQVITYTLSWCGELDDPNQIITSLICMPIYGKSVSTGSEWTCVGVGLNSGMVLFYTDAGIKIFSQCFHEDQVISLKAYSPPRRSEGDSFLYIVYDECVCIVKGFELFPLLNNTRHNVHRTLARSHSKHTLESFDILQYNKYKFSREHEMIVNDAVVAGSQQARAYDHIIDQCLVAGFYARISERPLQSSLVLGVGAEPYIGAYMAEEGYKTISLSEVAKDVIGNAYKNLLGNLFRRPQEPKTPEEPPSKDSNMRTRSRLYDGKRDGFHIVLSPDSRLAAVTDNLDRVLLVDSQRCVILRIFKGYRDAQCAFICVKEKLLKSADHTRKRKALFLVIYAPRLGCLEIWALQNGPKVAAFTVCKCGQLIYNTHGLLGVTPGSKSKPNINCCLFLDPSDASVKDIQIPFHFALSETNSKTSRDVHILRRLKNILRDKNEKQLNEVESLAAEFQTIEVRQQCLQMLRKNRQLQPDIFQKIIHAFLDSFMRSINEIDESGNTPLNDEAKSFLKTIQNYKRLVDFYVALKSSKKSEFDEHLEICDTDLVIINQLLFLLLDCNHLQTTEKVTFQEHCKDDGDFVDYLSVFDFENTDSITLLRSKSELFGYVSCKLFEQFFKDGLCFDYFKLKATEVNICCEDLLVLALNYWLEKPFDYKNCDEIIKDMSCLAAMVRSICELAGERASSYAYNSISPWWQNVRELLLDSPKAVGLLVAIVCKTVALELWRYQREDSCDEATQIENGNDDRWERISHEEAQWSLLINKLEDIAVLGAVIEHPMTSAEPVMPSMPYEPPDCSLKLIINGGKGIVSDLSAQWILHSRIHPKHILENTLDRDTIPVEKSDNSCGLDSNSPDKTEIVSSSSCDPIIQKLKLLRMHFPFSLESGLLFAQMAWQYMVHWSKDLSSLDHMRAGITCLAEFQTADLALKHGMCCLLWNATLKFPLQSTMKLIQKVGRLPSDKMCRQDLEMSSAHVPEFLELALEFLEHFETSINHEKRDIKFEENLVEGQLPLQFIALQQHHAMIDLLKLHKEVCMVMHLITYFQLKIHKPLTTLFDALGNKAFLADINKELSFVLTAPDLVLQQLRREFLFKVISASMDLIREDTEGIYITDHVFYMRKVLTLAESWKLDQLVLKQQQVVQMYAHGYDDYAESFMKDLIDIRDIGPFLLEIAGRRLDLYTSKSQTAYLTVASVGPQLLQYLDSLGETESENQEVSKTNCKTLITSTSPEEISIAALKILVAKTVECLSKIDTSMTKSTTTRYLHIAAQMFDACSLLSNPNS